MQMQITFGEGLRVDAEYRGFTIRTDQPIDEGGEGSAPEPFTYFLASIGTCAGIYVLSFLKHHDLPTEGVRLVQKNVFDPAHHRLSKVDIEIVVPKDFPEKYRKALVRSADLCAVKRVMADPPDFAITTVEG